MQRGGNIASQPDSTSIALVGNANVGKSVIFGLLTGKYVVVSNYPGTTVEVSSGAARLAGRQVEIIDTPGVNSLVPRSEDEEVARAILLDRRPGAVIQVLDSKNLRRGLMITTQLAEMGLPTVLALNMWDEAMDRGIAIDAGRLSQKLNMPIVKTVATHKKGIGKLVSSVAGASAPAVQIDYGPTVEEAIARLEELLPQTHLSGRSLAVSLLAGDPGLAEKLTALSGASEAGPRRRRRRWRGGKPDAPPEKHQALPEANAQTPANAENHGQSGPADLAESVAAIREQAEAKLAEPLSYFINKKRAAYVDGLVSNILSVHRSQAVLPGGAFFYGIGPALSLVVGYVTATVLVALVGKFTQPQPWMPWATGGLGLLIGAVYTRYLIRRRPHFNSISALLSQLLMDPVLAFPVLATILYGVYILVGVVGSGICVDFIENKIFGDPSKAAGGFDLFSYHVPFAGINYYLARAAEQVLPRDNLIFRLLLGKSGLISVGITYSVAIVLPIVGFFFLAFAFLEDSGYLPRLAVTLDWIFKKIGLNGKAVLPMVLGLGCGTMATLTTRILDSKRERVIATFLLALAIPCSAQLGVISGVLADIGGGTAFALYVAVIVSQLLVGGWLASKLVRGKNTDFLLELPPLRMPRFKNVVIKTFYRMVWFMKEAVPLFLLGTLALFILTNVGYNEKSRPLGLLSYAERIGEPVTRQWLGLTDDAAGDSPQTVQNRDERHFSTTEAFIMGFLRRDYGAVNIKENFDKGFYNPRQAMVALVVITLFVPCLANMFVIIKERGAVVGLLIIGIIIPYAFLIGGLLNRFLLITRMF